MDANFPPFGHTKTRRRLWERLLVTIRSNMTPYGGMIRIRSRVEAIRLPLSLAHKLPCIFIASVMIHPRAGNCKEFFWGPKPLAGGRSLRRQDGALEGGEGLPLVLHSMGIVVDDHANPVALAATVHHFYPGGGRMGGYALLGGDVLHELG